MKNTDDSLREQLCNKLNDYESPVPEGLWQQVSTQIPANPGALSRWSTLKVAAAVVAAAVISAVAFYNADKSSDNQANSSLAPTENNLKETPLTPNQEATAKAPAENPLGIHTAENVKKPVAVETFSQSENSENKQDPTPFKIEAIGMDKVEAVIPVYSDHSVLPMPNTITEREVRNAEFSVVEADKSGLTFFFIPQNTTASTYRWNFGDGESSQELSPAHSYSEPGDYTVTLETDNDGSAANQSKTITALPQAIIEAPTIFTPNADGKNDTFDVLALSRYITLEELRVYDLSGAIVHIGNGTPPWNGENAQGMPLPEGNYVYKLIGKDLRQQPVEKSGTVYLRR